MRHASHKGSGLASGLHIGIRLQVWEVAVNIFNRQAWTTGMECLFSLGTVRGEQSAPRP